jgi:hypothetical protein
MTMLEKILGTSWSLEAYQSEDKQGNINYPLGDDAHGVIIFTNEQRMAVQIMAANREEEISAEILDSMNTETEKEMAKLGYHAYSGPFDFDEDKAYLTTHVDMSAIASYVGSDQTRSAKIEGDMLYLSNVKHPERKLVWKKIEA